jgi:mannose-6-phosphate isomerase-like protein (cupin superfamily)
MKYRHIKSEDVKENDFDSVVVQNLLMDEQYEKFSVAKVKIIGEQEFGIDQESDLAYYVLEGEGEFNIEEDKFYVKKGDLIFIPKNTKYKDFGDLTLLAISVPKFNRDKRVRSEIQ